DAVRVPFQGAEELAAVRLPDADDTILRGRGEPAAVRAERQSADRTMMNRKLAQESEPGDIPEANDTVLMARRHMIRTPREGDGDGRTLRVEGNLAEHAQDCRARLRDRLLLRGTGNGFGVHREISPGLGSGRNERALPTREFYNSFGKCVREARGTA